MANKKALALDRVISITSQMILERNYADISVAEIASEARCSTATIYEVYGTKDNLYVDALAQLLYAWAPPAPGHGEGCALQVILQYAQARTEYFAHRQTRMLVKALRESGERGRIVAQQLMEARASFGALVMLVEQAFDEQTLRRTDGESVAYLIAAGAIYEAFTGAVLLGNDAPVDVAMIMKRIFLPLVEGEGIAILERFASAIPTGPIAHRLPLAAHNMNVRLELDCSTIMRKTLIGLGVPAPHCQHH